MPEQTQTQTSSPSSAGTRTLSLLLHHTGGYHHSLQRKKKKPCFAADTTTSQPTGSVNAAFLPSFLLAKPSPEGKHQPPPARPSDASHPIHPARHFFLFFVLSQSPVQSRSSFPSLPSSTIPKKKKARASPNLHFCIRVTDLVQTEPSSPVYTFTPDPEIPTRIVTLFSFFFFFLPRQIPRGH